MLLQVSHISKHYGTTTILSDITMQVLARERIGLVGVNGAGKSTLLKIIAGELPADAGDIILAKEAQIGYLAQAGAFTPGGTLYGELMSVFSHLLESEAELRRLERLIADPDVQSDDKRYEQTLARYSTLSDEFRKKGGYEVESNVRSVLHGMGFGGFDPETPVDSLSGGQKTRLALARLLLTEPDLLMLDEPTNYLDIPTLTWLEAYLRNYPGAILVVSHDRYFLDALVTGIYEIERHTAKRYTGNYSRYMELKAQEYEIQLKHFEKQQDEIARMEDFVRRNIVRASTTKRAQSRRKSLEKIERLDRPAGDLKRASFRFEIDRVTGNDVLKADALSIGYEPGKPLASDISFDLQRGDMAALIGPNGTGKSTLLKTLIGKQEALGGSLRWGSGVKIGYYDQEQTGLDKNQTVLEEVWNAYPHLEEVTIRTVLGNFLFSGEDVQKKIGSLSGGEKARVSLAKLMLLRANVLILDEPTNHLDLFSKEVLESALMDYEGTVLFISHDRYFLNKLADRVLEMHEDGVRHFLGNYDDYVEKKAELLEMDQEAGAKSGASAKTNQPSAVPVSNYESQKQSKREERGRQRRISQLEEEIAQLEERIASLEAELALPEVYQDYVAVQERQQAADQARSQLAGCYEEWEQLMEE